MRHFIVNMFINTLKADVTFYGSNKSVCACTLVIPMAPIFSLYDVVPLPDPHIPASTQPRPSTRIPAKQISKEFPSLSLSLCVHAYVHVCVCVCVRACACVRVRACACVSSRVCFIKIIKALAEVICFY